MKHVIKRDGEVVEFDHYRISDAIMKAMEACGRSDFRTASRIAVEIGEENPGNLSVESIQDLVERKLMSTQYKDVAKAYVLKRDERTRARNRRSDSMIAEIVAAKKNEVTRENANMNASSPAGMMYKIGSERSKEYSQMNLLSEEAKRYVDMNLIHVHDLDHYALRDINCLQHPLDKILKEGFKAGHGESRPAQRIETASIMACISLETVQNEMFGGQSIPAFDFYMAPFVRKTYVEEVKYLERVVGPLKDLYNEEVEEYVYRDTRNWEKGLYKQIAVNRTVERVHQAMEALVHNLNQIHSRGGNQVTFSSLNYGTDTSPEGRCVMRELMLSTEKGVGNGKTAVFPIQVFLLKEGVNRNPGDPNYDLYELACRVTAKRFFPNFLNLDSSFNKDEDWEAEDPERYKHQVYTMGCVHPKSVVVYGIGEKVRRAPISNMWRELKKYGKVRSASEEGYGAGEFIDLEGVWIEDQDKRVECLRIIRNPNTSDWVRVRLESGALLLCTLDHPWSLEDGSVCKSTQLTLGTKVQRADGFWDTIIGLDREYKESRPTYDVTTASEHFNVSGIRSHNCRTRVYEDRFGPRLSIGRGNLSFTTINLPGLALKALREQPGRGDLFHFMRLLDETIDVVGRQLKDRYDLQCKALADQFPMLMGGHWVGSEGLKPDDTVESVLKHGTLGVGFIGLAEALIALLGKHHGEDAEAQKFGLGVIDHMRNKVKMLADEYNLNFSLFATPAEGLSGKFTRKDKKLYGIIKGVTDKDYYTNSSHVPVYYKCTPSHKFKIEGPYHKLCLGGHIGYVELDGDATKNPEAVMQCVELGCQNDLGYISVNHWSAECPNCGHHTHNHQETHCPHCGTQYHILERITGYLVAGDAMKWNEGKLGELKDRVAHGS